MGICTRSHAMEPAFGDFYQVAFGASPISRFEVVSNKLADAHNGFFVPGSTGREGNEAKSGNRVVPAGVCLDGDDLEKR